MIERLMWIVAVLSLIGTILNVYQRRECFLFWIATNAAWVAYDIHKGALPQAALIAVYFGLSVYGFHRWKPKQPHHEEHEERIPETTNTQRRR